MRKDMRIRFVCALILLSFLPITAQADISDRIAFSGFGRIVGGYLDEGSAKFEGYDNSVSFSQQSLFALQSDITITEELSLSAQLLAHSAFDRKSGLEWLYVNYEPNQNWRFKLGKLRTPFFRYSDVIDVGFAYPWLTPPIQKFSSLLFSNYEGATGTYRFNLDATNVEVEAFYGTFDGELTRTEQSIKMDVDEIKGLIFSLTSGNLSARVSTTMSSDFDADVVQFTELANLLDFAGFQQNAESLRFDGDITVYQGNINYDTLDYFVSAEWMKVTSDLLVIPALDGYYLSAGYNFAPFQIHLSYSTSNSKYDNVENLVPKGLDPQLTQLSFAYDQVIDSLPDYELDTVTLGLRWDLRYNISAKAEVTFLKGKPGKSSFFTGITDPDFDRKAKLYQIGVEWVF